MKLGLLSLCLCSGMLLSAENRPPSQSEDMRRAIAWEHYKEAAAARQARIEARRHHTTVNRGARERAAEEESTGPGRRVVDPGPPVRQKNHPE
jgi:hypothetical protein